MPTAAENYMHHYLKLEYDKILAYDNKLSIPKWYRGLSNIQVCAAFSLINALRDDVEQGTTHRVKQMLNTLGLHPLVSEKSLALIMKFSRGNDLAFLYFLLEMCYRRSDCERKKNGYNMNEQLIMTTIYQLDMITTMRELDSILPPGHPCKEVLERRKLLAEKKQKEDLKSKPKRNSNVCLQSPYFQRQPMPKPYGKSLYLEKPPLEVQFQFKEHLKNLAYQMLNTTSRWFENFQMQPELRTAKALVDECIGKEFKGHQHDLDCPITLKCEQYRLVSEIQQILQCRFKLMAQDRCLKSYKAGEEEWQNRLDILVGRLIMEIKNYLRIYSIARKKTSDNNIQVINPNGTFLYFITMSEVKTYYQTFRNLFLNKTISDCPGENTLDDIKVPADAKVVTLKRNGSCDILIDLPPPKPVSICARKGYIECSDCKTKHLERTCPKSVKRVCTNNSKMDAIGDCPCPKDFDEELAPELSEESPRSSEIYFTAPSPNKPSEFHYKNIYQYDLPDNEEMVRKKLILSALNENATRPYVFDATLNEKPDLDKAVEHIAADCFVQKYRENLQHMESGNKHPISPLFNRTFYDCNDEELMKAMIKDAICHMRKNPKFVLVTLPGAHKLPVFLEYIKHRYGKRYTKKELDRYVHESLTIYESIIRAFFDTSQIKFGKMPQDQLVGYDLKYCVKRKLKPAIDDFIDKIKTRNLEQARLSWYTAKPHYGKYQHIRDPFYCYTPSKWSDVKFFRVWKMHDYRDMTVFSTRRRLENNKKY